MHDILRKPGEASLTRYEAPWWLPGGHLQTIWPALLARRARGVTPCYRRERWTTPDQDFVDVDWLVSNSPKARITTQKRPLLVLFHGLEGNSRSHYAEAFGSYANDQGWHYAVPHFRGCSGEINLAPRAYHSGDFQEIDWILAEFKRRHDGPIVALGVSLGGNALMKWAQEMGNIAAQTVTAVASVCSPLDLAASGHAIGRGFNRQVYARMFLRSMKPKALRKLDQHPGLFDRAQLLRAEDLYQFDQVFTAPLHGFESADQYWREASAKPHLNHIRIPALLVNALNDPFVPATSLPQKSQVGAHVQLWQPKHGGHVGFVRGAAPGDLQILPEVTGAWFAQNLGVSINEPASYG